MITLCLVLPYCRMSTNGREDDISTRILDPLPSGKYGSKQDPPAIVWAIYENTPYASIFSRPPIDCLANIPGSKSIPRPLCDPLRVAAMKKTAVCLVLLYDRNKFIGSGRYILGSYIKWHVPIEIHQPEPKPQRRTRFPMI